MPRYVPRAPRPQRLDPYRAYLREGVEAYPRMRATRLLREIRELGYPGGYSQLTAYPREIPPPLDRRFEHRFETAPGEQAQVDFAQFKTDFTPPAADPETRRTPSARRLFPSTAAEDALAASHWRDADETEWRTLWDVEVQSLPSHANRGSGSSPDCSCPSGIGCARKTCACAGYRPMTASP